jgi:RNA polymerase sigma-70 factor (ECF subfamily)
MKTSIDKSNKLFKNVATQSKIDKSWLLKQTWKQFNLDRANNPNSFQSFSFHLTDRWDIAKVNKAIDFDLFYVKNYNRLLFFLNGKTKNIDLAQELCNDSFLKVLNQINTNIFDSRKSKLSTYLFLIANGLFINHFNSLKTFKSIEGKSLNISDFVDSKGNEFFQISDNSSNIEVIQENQIINNDINKVVNSLDEKYRKVSDLYFINKYKYHEIAEILNININTVKTHIKRAKEHLLNGLDNSYSHLKDNAGYVAKQVKQVNANSNIIESIDENELFYEVDNDSFYY